MMLKRMRFIPSSDTVAQMNSDVKETRTLLEPLHSVQALERGKSQLISLRAEGYQLAQERAEDREGFWHLRKAEIKPVDFQHRQIVGPRKR